ncbi:Dps family protein [Streptomyces sp. NPDC086010]|uniref:Dps family protein n=1 Tax=Streptomyces sp. NPDC086010 TaxID=3365745 RepID=UPI0037CF95F6
MSPKNPTPRYTVPGLTTKEGAQVIDLLGMRLHSLNDLALTLKHIHWNVTGPHFIAVHEMLDPQTLAVRDMADATAERISALGGVPQGTAGVLVAERTWEDYSVGRADAIAHLGALDLVYTGIIEDHRKAAAKAASLDPVTEDLLIEHLRSLEQFQWFVRAHLENSAGALSTADSGSEKKAAAAAGPSRPIPAKKTANSNRAAKKPGARKRTA